MQWRQGGLAVLVVVVVGSRVRLALGLFGLLLPWSACSAAYFSAPLPRIPGLIYKEHRDIFIFKPT